MPATRSAPSLGGPVWNTFTPGATMTAREYVDAIAVLLQGVLAANGNQRPEVLIDQLRATLSLGGPQSSMPMPSALTRPVRELLTQAVLISDQLTSWADEALGRLITQPEPLPNGPLGVRSHCYGHNLIPPAIHILLGPQGGPVPMMLYNEWIHQMVLLRDALLPFSNWQDVPLPVDGQGLRRLERPRDGFLSELLIRQIRHAAIVHYARQVLAPGRAGKTPGYGFAYAGGTVLPAVAGSATVLTSTDLLAWMTGGATAPGTVSTYVVREADYFAATRAAASQIARGGGATLAGATARISDEPRADGSRHAAIEVNAGGRIARIDLGQALRGHRYAYPVHVAGATAPHDAAGWLRNATMLDPASILRAPGLVWDEAGEYAIDAGQDGLVALALLGAVFPENVVLRSASDDTHPASVGKTGPARFVITLPDER
jgi:hypothetical protein